MTDKDIASIGISFRVCKVLRKNGIETVQDIIDSYGGLIELEGVGAIAVEEIKEKVKPYLRPKPFALTEDGIKTNCFACVKRRDKYLCNALNDWYGDRYNKCKKCPFYKTREQAERKGE